MRHSQGKQFHAAIGAAYGATSARVRDLMNDFWKKSTPYANGLADPGLSSWRDMERQFMVHKFLNELRLGPPQWLPVLNGFTAGTCQVPPPPDPSAAAAIAKDANTPAAHPGQCIPPAGQFGLGPVNTKWDCQGLTIQGGEGLMGGVSVKFAGPDGKGTLSGHTETTVFAGIGDQLAIGAASGEAKAVISFTQSQGQVVDAGAEYSTSASAPGMGSKAEAGTDLTWSMRSGPNMSFGASASWGERAGLK